MHFLDRLKQRYNIVASYEDVARIVHRLNFKNYPMFPFRGENKAAIIKFDGQLVAVGCPVDDGYLTLATALSPHWPEVRDAFNQIGTQHIREARRDRPDFWQWSNALKVIDRMDRLIDAVTHSDADEIVALYELLLNSFNSERVLKYFPGLKDYENSLRAGVFNLSTDILRFTRNQVLEYFVAKTSHDFPLTSWDLLEIKGRFAVQRTL